MQEIIVSRTGYGQDGFEIHGSHDYTRKVWDKLMEAGVRHAGWVKTTRCASKWAFPFMATS